MNTYLLTEDQLTELLALVWGADFLKPGEPERFNALIQEIKKQPLSVKAN